MKKIVLIEQDKIVLGSLLKTMERFSEEKIRVDSFASLEEFNQKYFESKETERTDSEKAPADANNFLSNTEIHSSVDLLVISAEFLGDKPSGGIQFLLKKLKDNKYAPKEKETLTMILGYYEEDLHLKDYEHPGVVDFIFKPIDSQLFLQKLEVAFHSGENIESSYLATADIQEKISIGKLGNIEELSDFGLAIRNPRPIMPGQFARFYSQMFFCKESPSLLGRCYMNLPHPDIEGEFLSYFSYFGIRREQLLNIRISIQKNKSLEVSTSHSEAVASIDTVDHSKDKKDIIVIDNDPSSLSVINEVYNDLFKNIKVHGFSSYTAFMKKLLSSQSTANPLDEFNSLHKLGTYSQTEGKDSKGDSAKEEPGFVALSERYRAVPVEDKLHLEISKAELKLARISLQSEKDYDCFGIPTTQFKSDPEIWRSIIHEYSMDEFEEFLEISLAGQQGRMDFWGVSQDTSPARIRIEVKSKPNSINMSISDITHSYRPEKEGPDSGFEQIYAIYIDGSMIRSEDKNQFLKNLKNSIKKAGLKPKKRKVKINILGLEDGETRSSKYELENVDDFFYRPLDRTLIRQKMMLYVFPFEKEIRKNKIDYYQDKHDVVLSTYVDMKKVSEHGVAITYKIPFKEGTFMRFISKNFYLDNGSPMIGRCYFSDKAEEDQYISYFEFFGVTDEVFKRIRVWMRESYIEGKTAS